MLFSDEQWRSLLEKIRTNDKSLGPKLRLKSLFKTTEFFFRNFCIFDCTSPEDKKLEAIHAKELAEVLKVNSSLTTVDLDSECAQVFNCCS